MLFQWLPWKRLLRWLARSHGFIDPVAVLGQLNQFAQPAEVAAPVELLRAGVVFHARGLLNTKAIQTNLDWQWPYWVRRQFDPADESFIPRAFSLTHVNLTQRNWTAVGLPGCDAYPIVDAAGTVTPLFDGWSLEAWLLDEAGSLVPSSYRGVPQRLAMDAPGGLAVETTLENTGRRLAMRVWADAHESGAPVCRLRISGKTDRGGLLAIAVRPYNPEGVSPVRRVEAADGGTLLRVNRTSEVRFDAPMQRMAVSTYVEGDVFAGLPEREARDGVHCEAGMATTASLFSLEAGEDRTVTVSVPLDQKESIDRSRTLPDEIVAWPDALAGAATLAVPDAQYRFLYDAAVRSLILHTHRETYPGPFTYKRFWFRDAAFILNALMSVGLAARAEPVLDGFRDRQTATGFFRSQDGEWDSNGAALWTYERFCALTGRPPKPEWRRPIVRGAEWFRRKRTAAGTDALHAGLLPAGFSAEHLGNNDFYYWDDFWGIAGLRAAATLARDFDSARSARFAGEAEEFRHAVTRSLERSAGRRSHHGMPASPYRRMDAGAVGSLVGSYPLGVLDARDGYLLGTADFLLAHCLVKGGFYQDMIHSGINIYLTLHLAQVLLRAGDNRWGPLVRAVAELASPTGQWPEAVHPRTGGGCMGDGQHVWASAEWVMMMRSLFVREERDQLVIGSGVLPEWLEQPGAELRFGPTATPWGSVTVQIRVGEGQVEAAVDAAWRGERPPVTLALPGMTPAPMPVDETGARMRVARAELDAAQR
jgi:hypothetical protein